MFREDCWFLHGFKFGNVYLGFLSYHSSGERASVEFDWEKAFKSKNFLGWFHTHPGEKHLYPSSTDNKTMRSWIKATSRSFLCGIKCGDEHMCYKYFGKWMEIKRETAVFYNAVNSKIFGSFFIGVDRGRVPFSASMHYEEDTIKKGK